MFVFIVREYIFREFNNETIYASHEGAMAHVVEFTGEENPSESENWEYFIKSTPRFSEQETETWEEVGEEATGSSIQIVKYLVHE